MPSTMSAPDPTSHSFVHDLQEPDFSEADVSKPLPPQPASRYTGNPARYVEAPTQKADPHMSIIKVQDLFLDTASGRVRRGGRHIDLTAEQFSILHFLMQHPGTKVYPEELIQREMGTGVDRSFIEAEIGKLRAKIDFPNEAELIYQCGSFYQLGGSFPRQMVAEIPQLLRDEVDALFERMQTPEGRAAMQAAYDASPEEMGKAAVAAARKRD